MKIENHILDILQLYEYAMAIGKSLNYKENCDSFLKLILKRKHLNAAWILQQKDNKLVSVYSLPKGKDISLDYAEHSEVLKTISTHQTIDFETSLAVFAPIKITKGQLAVFNLKDQGFLFLYTQQHNLDEKKISKVQPVFDKFYHSLVACKAFEDQQKLLENLKVQNQELSDYAHMVSHDLKSPLRSIDTLTLWLKEDHADKLGDNGKAQIDTIRTSVEKMEALINGILEYSTIGKNKTEFYPVNLNKLLEDVLNMLKIPEYVTIKLLELPTIQGDKYRLQQLFQNLICNAISFNDKTKPVVEIGAINTGDTYTFYVKDNGKGIDHAYHEKIFITFEKLDNNTKSTGMGLSIVKKIVDLYNGKIWLDSELGKGTTFYFTLSNQD